MEKNYNSANNLEALGLSQDSKRVKVLWMYPDTLSIHGGRGDMMALMRIATMLKLPLEIIRVELLSDEVPVDSADMIYFCSGDLSCTPDVIKALMPIKERLNDFAKKGKVIVANGSSGAILSKKFKRLDGTVVEGLGLLKMSWTQRESVEGNDLYLDFNGMEIIGNEIKLAEIELEDGQAPFAKVVYGHGNNGGKTEGAMTDNVIYTSCLGPLLVRNPWLAAELLKRAAGAQVSDDQLVLDEKLIHHETECLNEAKKFIVRKMD